MASMFFSVKAVQTMQDFLLRLTFKNGEVKIFDMKPYLEIGIFKELKEERIFNTAKLSFDAVEWENEADIDPETLYSNSVKEL